MSIFLETCHDTVPPLTAFLGGILAQEAIKGCSGRFIPLQNWLVGDFRECRVSHEVDSSLKDRSIFGETLQNKLANLRVFVVGAGAIGKQV